MNRASTASLRWRLPLQAGTGLGLAYSLHCRHPLRLDANSKPYSSNTNRSSLPKFTRRTLNPEMVKDCSRGSMAGFGAGLVVGFFSQVIVFASGLTMLTLHILHRWGLNIPELLGLKERLGRTVLNQPFNNAVFRLSFIATFTLAAFARF